LFTLDRNLEDVDSFYNKKYAEITRRIKLLRDRYGNLPNLLESFDQDEVEDLMGALLEIRSHLRNLQWYGEVNRRGFVKITKKLDKKIPNGSTQQRYLATKVDQKSFTTNYGISLDLRAVNDWLSQIGDLKIADDTSSVASGNSLKKVSSPSILSLPPDLLDTVDQAIKNDDSTPLAELLLEANTDDNSKETAFQTLLLNLLQRSISYRSKRCIDCLLQHIKSLEEDGDVNKRNCLHRLVISISRTKINEVKQKDSLSNYTWSEDSRYIQPAERLGAKSLPVTTTERENTTLLAKDDPAVLFLSYLLDHLSDQQRPALRARDIYGRVPLHYATQYGFVAICDVIIKHMQHWGQFDMRTGIDASEWQDEEGLAPLHLAVINQHPLATELILKAEKWQDNAMEPSVVHKRAAKSGAVLALATKTNSVAIVKLLVVAGVDVNHQDEQGETALHVAARFGNVECARALIDPASGQKANVDIPEHTFAWTPLFIACVDGHLRVVDLLVEAGADLERLDLSGWTAKEHAALRGHMKIANCLAQLTSIRMSSVSESTAPTVVSTSPSNAQSLEDRKSTVKDETSRRIPEPVKTFGHRYLQQQTMVLVSLGSMDMTKSADPVTLDSIPLADAHATQLDTALSIVVSSTGANGESTVIDLPVHDNISTDAITFMTDDISKVKLLFDLIPTYSGSKEKIVGRGVAVLSSLKPSIGSKRISLQGDLSIPIVAASTLDVIGSVHFNFLVITPFQHPNMSISEQHTYWKTVTSTRIIGHRGLGKNVGSRKSLQLGENTLQSFIAAANLGASYVEFDVQLTKDHVPVIYHDFLVSETGIDAPMHTLTLKQFLHVSESQTPRPSRPASPDSFASKNGTTSQKPVPRRPRANSLGLKDRTVVVDLPERMKHTRDFKAKGFKGNLRGNSIQAPFTTLTEMFEKLPEGIGFNIEMKYPMLQEAEEHDMDTYAIELNSFVDAVLQIVFDRGADRNIIFSSFHPDICLLLSSKQPNFPILFLTDADVDSARDIRASSLQEAIRFASRWNLLGIVSAANPLVVCPRLVRVVKESGLVCVTYGTLNNEPKNVQV